MTTTPTSAEMLRERFEKWYVENTLDYSLNRIGSERFTLQWNAVQAMQPGEQKVVEGVTGEVMEIGDDDQGQPRILIHSTRKELSRGGNLLFKRIVIVELL
jgi:hypothetical protein